MDTTPTSLASDPIVAATILQNDPRIGQVDPKDSRFAHTPDSSSIGESSTWGVTNSMIANEPTRNPDGTQNTNFAVHAAPVTSEPKPMENPQTIAPTEGSKVSRIAAAKFGGTATQAQKRAVVDSAIRRENPDHQ